MWRRTRFKLASDVNWQVLGYFGVLPMQWKVYERIIRTHRQCAVLWKQQVQLLEIVVWIHKKIEIIKHPIIIRLQDYICEHNFQFILQLAHPTFHSQENLNDYLAICP